MQTDQDHIGYIKQLLETKSFAKQITYGHLLRSFSILRNTAKTIAEELTAQTDQQDVTIEFTDLGDHEFHLKLAGDLLIYVLHTNIVTFEPEHAVMQDPYIQEKEINRYFGQIMIYNFMSDSYKYNRINDPGYLLARVMFNHENRYFIEGEGRLEAISNKISGQAVATTDLDAIVKITLAMAIENDLMAPPYPRVKFITLIQKLQHTPDLGGGQKIGFRMSSEATKR
jgi:hypothetical protein